MSNSIPAALAKAAKTNPELAAVLFKLMAEKSTPKAKGRSKPKAKAKAKSQVDPEVRKAVFAVQAVEAAKKAGYADAEANVNIFTWGKWQERGFTVKKGEKSFRVKTNRGSGLPLFHVSQVEPNGPEATTEQPSA